MIKISIAKNEIISNRKNSKDKETYDLENLNKNNLDTQNQNVNYLLENKNYTHKSKFEIQELLYISFSHLIKLRLIQIELTGINSFEL